jgi:hypothetical protein
MYLHVHVVTGQIQADEALKQDGPSRVCGGQEAEQTASCASVGDHVKHGAKFCGLVELAGGIAVQGIQQAREGVEDCAVMRMI